MSEAVSLFSQNSDFVQVRRVQEDILSAYRRNFAKHAGNVVGECCRMVFEFLPRHLAKENKSLYTERSRRVFVDASSTMRCNFCKTHGLTNAVRFSLSGYREESWMTNVPLVRSSLPCCFASIGSTWEEHHYLSRATPHL